MGRGGVAGVSLGVLTAALGASCEVPRTQLVVGVDTELTWGVDGQLQSVTLEVRRGGPNGALRSLATTALGSGGDRASLPLWVGVLSIDDSDATPVWIEALGCARPDGCTRETAVVSQRASVRFVARETGLVRLLLGGACVSRRCALTERCTVATGECVGVEAQDEVQAYGGTLPGRWSDASVAGEAPTVDVATDQGIPVDVATPPDVPAAVDVATDQGMLCPTGATLCSGACVSLATSANDCGACGNVCPSGQSCSSGVCGTVCPRGMSLCGTSCMALGGACTSTGSGGCATSGMVLCTSGSAACSASARTSGACTSPANGTCNAAGSCACAAGTHLCAGSCVSDTSVSACGSSCAVCAAPAGWSATCVSGACGTTCPSGMSVCSGACVSLATSASNCGACGHACTSAQVCGSGSCVALTCPTGMRLIPAGMFLMGATDDAPIHGVQLSVFCMDETEVTVAAYSMCTACTAPGTGTYGNWGVAGRENHPVNYVDWNQARAFCQSRGGDLPTDAQWEYAARGTDGRTYPWGNDAPVLQLCWSAGGTSQTGTCPVRTYPSGTSPFGLFDMAGNVAEWTADYYVGYTGSASSYVLNPTGPVSGSLRVLRGGAWSNTAATNVRASVRLPITLSYRNYSVGFRCARGAI